MKNDGGPAFPKYWHSVYVGEPDIHHQGMSLRDYFAAAALQGLNANADLSRYASERGFSPDKVRIDYAASAYEQADAMLAERAK